MPWNIGGCQARSLLCDCTPQQLAHDTVSISNDRKATPNKSQKTAILTKPETFQQQVTS